MPSVPNCPKCGELKVFVSKRWRCKPCDKLYGLEYNAAWYAKNRDRSLAQSNAYSVAHRAEAIQRAKQWAAANTEYVRVRNAKKYASNRQAERAKRRAAYRANPEPYKERARNSTWRADNPAGARAVVLRRRAVKANAICEHGSACVSNSFLEGLYASQCHYCGAPAEHADHFFPLAKGGLHCRDNLVPACAPCNTSKGASDPHLWMSSRL